MYLLAEKSTLSEAMHTSNELSESSDSPSELDASSSGCKERKSKLPNYI